MKSTNSKCGVLLARIFAIFFFICLAECAAGSCLSYGHSCWGAHGKRAGPKSGPAFERSRAGDGQGLFLLSRYFGLNPEAYRGQYDVNQERKIVQTPSMRDFISNYILSSGQLKIAPEDDYPEAQLIPSNEADAQDLSISGEQTLNSGDEDTTDDRRNRRNKLMQSLAMARSLKM